MDRQKEERKDKFLAAHVLCGIQGQSDDDEGGTSYDEPSLRLIFERCRQHGVQVYMLLGQTDSEYVSEQRKSWKQDGKSPQWPEKALDKLIAKGCKGPFRIIFQLPDEKLELDMFFDDV